MLMLLYNAISFRNLNASFNSGSSSKCITISSTIDLNELALSAGRSSVSVKIIFPASYCIPAFVTAKIHTVIIFKYLILFWRTFCFAIFTKWHIIYTFLYNLNIGVIYCRRDRVFYPQTFFF